MCTGILNFISWFLFALFCNIEQHCRNVHHIRLWPRRWRGSIQSSRAHHWRNTWEPWSSDSSYFNDLLRGRCHHLPRTQGYKYWINSQWAASEWGFLWLGQGSHGKSSHGCITFWSPGYQDSYCDDRWKPKSRKQIGSWCTISEKCELWVFNLNGVGAWDCNATEFFGTYRNGFWICLWDAEGIQWWRHKGYT